MLTNARKFGILIKSALPTVGKANHKRKEPEAMSTHIEAKAGSIAPRILLPGDPLRAKYIAENFLKDAVQFNNVRGMLG